jgi:hypothetical protein
VTTTSLDDAMRAGTRFWQLLNLRVFQQYPSIRDLAQRLKCANSGPSRVDAHRRSRRSDTVVPGDAVIYRAGVRIIDPDQVRTWGSYCSPRRTSPLAVFYLSRRGIFDMRRFNFVTADGATVVGADCLI